jgi:phosphatidate cytidylyltransferase
VPRCGACWQELVGSRITRMPASVSSLARTSVEAIRVPDGSTGQLPAAPYRGNMLIHRVLSAAVLIPIVIITVYFGGVWFFGLATLAAVLATYEFLTIVRRKGYRPPYILGVGLAVLLMVSGLYRGLSIGPFGLALVSMITLVWELLQGNTPGSLESWALTVAGPLYIGGLCRHFVMLRALPQGIYWIGLAFLTTWLCDSAAYFVGNWKGKHPFFERISPRKTREGAIAGLITGTITGALVGLLLRIPLYIGVPLGLLISLAATFGDLAESLIKRQVGVKDSSNLIPGHGGALDRIDSLMFAVVVVYYFALWAPVALGGVGA